MKRGARGGIVCRVTAADLELENNALRQQLSDRNAKLIEQAATID